MKRLHLVLALALGLVLWLIAIGWVRPLANVPMNDDWVLARAALNMADTGQYTVNAYQWAWCIPQLVYGALLIHWFDFSHTLLRMSNLLCIVVAAAGFAFVVYRTTKAFTTALLCVLAFFFFPPLFINANSFMSDPPFLAAWLWALILLEISLERRDVRLLLLGGVACAICLLQRQYGLTLVLVGVGYTLLHRIRRRPFGRFEWCWLAVFLGLLILFAAGWLHWLSLPRARSLDPLHFFRLDRFLWNAAFSGAYLGLACFPLLLIAIRGVVGECRLALKASPGLAFLMGVMAAALVLASLSIGGEAWMPYTGNQISRFGLFRTNEVLVGERETSLGMAVRVLMTAMAVMGFVGMLVAGHEHRRKAGWGPATPVSPASKDSARVPAWGRLMVPASLVYLVMIAVEREHLFDRYVIPLLPTALGLVATFVDHCPDRRDGLRVAAALVAITAIGLFSATLTKDWFAWSQARWDAASWAVAQGIDPRDVEGGYEWDGWHRPMRETLKGGGKTFPWYQSLFGNPGHEAVVSFSQLPGYALMRTFPFRSSWPPHERKLYLLRVVRRR